MKMRSRTLSLAGASLLGFLCVSVPAQEIDDDAIRVSDLVERAEVRLLLVDVVVIGKDGRPVTDLKKEDFRLFLHNRPVSIDSFDVRDLTPIRVAPAPDSPAEPELLRPIQKQKHWVVLFFDTLNSGMRNQLAVRQQVLDHLERRMLPADEMMVISFSDRMRVLQNFSSDRERWLGTVRELAADESDLDSYLYGKDKRIQDVIYTCKGMGCDAGWNLARSFVGEERNRGLRSIQALNGLVLALGGLEGKKSVIYLSEGVPSNPGSDFFAAARRFCRSCSGSTEELELEMESIQQEMENLFRDANDSNVTFHTIDSRRMEIGFQEFLSNLAFQTGGVRGPASVLPARNLEKMADQVGVYYTLGHNLPGVDPDGHRYPVRVEVKRRGVQVRHRQSFRDFGWREREERILTGAIALPDVFRDVPVEGRVHPVPAGGERFEAYLEVGLPLSSVYWIPTPVGEFGQVEFVGAVTDQWGRVQHDFRDSLEMKRVSEGNTELSRGVFYRGHVNLKPGRYEMVCAVHDLGTGRVGAVRVPFVVPEPREKGLWLSGPSLGRLARGDLVVGAYSPYPRKKRKKFPKKYREEKIVPLFENRLSRGDVLVTSLEVFDPEGKGASSGDDLEVRVSLLREGEVLVREPAFLVENEVDSESRTLRYASTTPLEGLPDGAYDLLVEVIDGNSDRDLMKVVPLRIRTP